MTKSFLVNNVTDVNPIGCSGTLLENSTIQYYLGTVLSAYNLVQGISDLHEGYLVHCMIAGPALFLTKTVSMGRSLTSGKLE